MMLSIISSRSRQSGVSQLMRLSITFHEQLCPPPPGLLSSHPHFPSPQGEVGSAGWQRSGQFTSCSLYFFSGPPRAVVLKVQTQAQHQRHLGACLEMRSPRPFLRLTKSKTGLMGRVEWNTKTYV